MIVNDSVTKAGRRLRAVMVGLIAVLFGSLPSVAVTVHLGPQDASSTVILHMGDRLRVEVPSAPATGFRWKARLLDASHLQLLSRDVRPDADRLDATGVQVFVWKAIAPGRAEVGLDYSRPGDGKSVGPAKQMAISVEVVAGELAASDNDLVAPEVEIATYNGTLPCGNCTGIAVDLTVFAGKATGSNFVERRRYQGAPGGDRTIAGTGTLAVMHGAYADPSMTVYVLNAADGSTENFKVDGDRLVPLDGLMVPIPPPAGREIALHKVAASAP